MGLKILYFGGKYRAKLSTHNSSVGNLQLVYVGKCATFCFELFNSQHSVAVKLCVCGLMVLENSALLYVCVCVEGKQTSGTRLSHVPSQQAASGESSTNTVGPPYSVTGEPPSIGQQHGSTLSGPVASGWTTPGSGSSLVAGSAEFSSSVAVSVSLLSSSQSPSVGFNSLQNVAPLLSGSGLSSQVPPATAPFTGYPDGGSSQSQSSAQNNTNPLPASLVCCD